MTIGRRPGRDSRFTGRTTSEVTWELTRSCKAMKSCRFFRPVYRFLNFGFVFQFEVLKLYVGDVTSRRPAKNQAGFLFIFLSLDRSGRLGPL